MTKASTICARGCNHRRQRLLYLQVLALWLGVDVPPEARADVYRGVVLLRDLSNPDPDSHPDPIPNSDPDPNSDPNPNPNPHPDPCQVISRMLHAKELLHIDAHTRSCGLAGRVTLASLEALATATIVSTSHSVLHVRLASLTMLQQMLLKVSYSSR